MGLNFDFLALNLTGFIAYSVFNVGLFWVDNIKVLLVLQGFTGCVHTVDRFISLHQNKKKNIHLVQQVLTATSYTAPNTKTHIYFEEKHIYFG